MEEGQYSTADDSVKEKLKFKKDGKIFNEFRVSNSIQNYNSK